MHLRSEIADAVIVGAGPAGSAAAHQCALRGLRTVLLDKQAFPREKVCGCCLSGAACAALDDMGLANILDQAGAIELRRIVLRAGASQVAMSTHAGRILSRGALDHALIGAAQHAGAAFYEQTTATSLDIRPHEINIAVRERARTRTIRARVLVVADGLAGRLLDGEFGHRTHRRGGAIGVGALLEPDASAIEEGVVELGIGAGGYVGVARVENSKIDIAAAIDPSSVSLHGGVAPAIASIAARNGMNLAGLTDANWKGTPTLASRRRSLGTRRVFVVGDAASFLEPITGEGIGLALASGASVASLVARGVERWEDSLLGHWHRVYGNVVRRRRGLCASASLLLRFPTLTKIAIGSLSYHPDVAHTLARMTATRFDLDLVRS